MVSSKKFKPSSHRMKNKHKSLGLAGMLVLGAALALPAQNILAQQEYKLPADTVISEDLAAHQARMKSKAGQTKGAPSSTSKPNIANDMISYLYLQTEDTVFHIRWHAVTHVSSLFVSFNSNGDFTNRVSQWDNRSSYLKAGGAAEAAGTKVILTVNNFDDDPGGDIETVLPNPALRANLIANVVDALQNDVGGYNAGVNFDIEFSWDTDVRDGIVALLSELRTALDTAGLQDKEISIYCNPTLSTSQWDIAGMEPNLDYLLYSGYTFAGSTVVNGVGDHDGMISSDNRMPGYLENGLPPEKLILTLPAYGRRYTDNTGDPGVGYGEQGTRLLGAVGFNDGLYETTIDTNDSGPQTNNYETGDETAWYTYNDGSDDITVVWEGLQGINYKIRHALALQDPTGGLNFDGAKIGGIGYWSSLWMAESQGATPSYDPRTSSSVGRTRTYPHIYQTLQEALSPPGTTVFYAERWEGYDFRWRDPFRALDTTGDTDNDSQWDELATPAGGPANSTNAARVIFDFESGSSNTGIFAHEVLNSNSVPGAADYHAVLANFDDSTKLEAQIYTPSALSGQTVRMLVIDSDLEIEAGPTISLNTTGWQTLTMDLTDSANISPFSTSEPNFMNGDGTIESAGGGARDIGFYGFAVEGAGPGAHTVYFDELTYEEAFPNNEKFVINELRYDGSDGEFVEIYGPANTSLSDLSLRIIDGASGSISSIALTGSTDGNGFAVAGDTDVTNVSSSSGFNTSVDDLPNTNPSGIQLYDTVNDIVHDSVVYEAFGGLDDLVRLETLGVTDEGYPWLGRIAPGTDASGNKYSKGRYPDGDDTNINAKDFGSMVASPGVANGDSVPGGTETYDFTTAPASGLQTFQSFAVTASGVGASPSGGNVHRCIDTSGGGVVSFIGDEGLSGEFGQLRVTGEIYIPAAAEPAQAIGVGICGTQGSTFFTNFPSSNGYEDGYWLIFENQSGIGLNDGRADHAGTFEFVHASNDNMDSFPVELLGSQTLAGAGITEGSWTDFEFIIDATASASSQLIARINGSTVYSGAIPEDGPVAGAVQIGFRENHSGAPVSSEGTWVDNIQINTSSSLVNEWLIFDM